VGRRKKHVTKTIVLFTQLKDYCPSLRKEKNVRRRETPTIHSKACGGPKEAIIITSEVHRGKKEGWGGLLPVSSAGR